MRVIFYARVSTEEQVEGFSIGAQLKAMQEYAHRHGWIPVGEFIDEGESARSDDRPQFQQMIAAARKKPTPFEVIIVHKFDRFARNRDDSAIYKSLLRKECGIEVRSVSEQTDSSPSGRLLEGVLEVVAEFYSNNLSQEVLKGQRERALQAKAMSVPAIGYVIGPDGRYQTDPNTAGIVRWLFEQYAQGTEGFRNLARRMQADGERLFGSVVRNYSWTGAYVCKILSNEVYQGTYVWGRCDSTKKWRVRPRSEWTVVEQAHEPIVAPELFERVQTLRKSRCGVRRAAPGEDYLFRGLTQCLDCGANGIKFRYQWTDRKTGEQVVRPCLLCGAYSKGKGCYCNRVPMADVEEMALRYLVELVRGRFEPEQLELAPNRRPTENAEILMLERRLVSIEKKTKRLMDAYAAEVLSLDELKNGKERLATERSALKGQIDRLRGETPGPDPHTQLKQLRSKAKDLFATASDAAIEVSKRRMAIEQVVACVRFSRRQDAVKVVLRV